MTTVLTGSGITYFQLAALKGAVKLEAVGLRHSSGRSMSAQAKRICGLKRNATVDQVVAALQVKMNEILAAKEAA
jgi:hypothetical protein